ncbi:polysaccharide biosynthesis C-terminal domain-containing protein [Sphingobacterium spiritivorum]|nr:polysaccharide biosynthesis C-terminal domain-containing protein [Sphingobacterium spiritivorum]QQS98273.1 polysaccharide biosynthesis C-terminal domain-containing protein [Sphingobacterium spiritivorum]
MIYGLSTIFSRLLYFIMTPLYVSKYPPAAYGIFTNMYAWASMINAVLAFGMETTYFRYLQKVEEKDKQRVFNNSFIVIAFFALLFLISANVFSGQISALLNKGQFDQDYQRYIQYFAIILTADALAVVPFAKLRSQGRPVRFAIIKLVNILTMIGLNLFFILIVPVIISDGGVVGEWFAGWFKDGWIGYVFISNLVASVLTLVLMLPEMRQFSFQPDRKLIKSMLSYSFPILIANISFIINENLDKIVMPMYLPKEIGDRDNGIYGAVSKLAMFLSIFVQAFRLGAEPFFFSYSKNANARSTYAFIMEYLVIAMMIVMVGISANIEWLKFFIKGDAAHREIFWSGLFIVPLLLFNYVLLGIYMNLSVWYKLSDQTRYALYISGIGALITVVANYFLIPRYSYAGAAFVTFLAYASMVILSYIWGQKNYPIPYKVGKMLVYMVIGAGITYLSNFVFDRNLIIGNGLFVVFLAGIFIAERKKIKAVLKR